jgi:hypothetical protein
MTPTPLLGYQLHWIHRESNGEDLVYQPHILYKTWEEVLDAAATLAIVSKTNEYIQVLNKVDEYSMSDCLSFKNTILYILVDECRPYERYGAVWVCPVYGVAEGEN